MFICTFLSIQKILEESLDIYYTRYIIHAFQKQDLFKLLNTISLDVVNRKTYCIVYFIVLWAHED